MPLTFAQLCSGELYFQPAAIQLLTEAGYEVVSPFVSLDPETGKPNVAALQADHCIVVAELMQDEGDRMVFQAATERSLSVPAAWRMMLRVTHAVSVDDRPAAVGQDPGCYKRLLIQRGEIRALFLHPDNLLQGLLPDFDILSVRLAAPERSTDRELSVNQATEVFDIRYGPADSMPSE